MDNIVLYTIGCPKCVILEKKMDAKGVQYTKITDVKTITDAGFDSVPVLEVNGEIKNFPQAIKWINSL